VGVPTDGSTGLSGTLSPTRLAAQALMLEPLTAAMCSPAKINQNGD